ncbi:MAG: substrate-binding domain-containing protein [Lachnospiraceae bacterium]|nr:substrate-binding domain-containing protein [Lachnospiraceae bacterium]
MYEKKILSILMSAAMIATLLVGCGSSETTTTDSTSSTNSEVTTTDTASDTKAEATVTAGKKVGVAMPTQSSERWINDGANMKSKLEALGYEVDLQYAEDDVQMQVSQIENMIASGVNCLVIASIDSAALVNVEAQAKAVLEGSEPEINDTEQYNNGVITVPSYLCTPIAVDVDNYQKEIVDGGYYTAEQLAE